MPWHLFNSPDVIDYTLDTLGAAIGPLYGILVVDFFVVKHEKLYVDDLYSEKPDGRYWYSKGFNPAAVKALVIGFFGGLLFVVIPQLTSWPASRGSSARRSAAISMSTS